MPWLRQTARPRRISRGRAVRLHPMQANFLVTHYRVMRSVGL